MKKKFAIIGKMLILAGILWPIPGQWVFSLLSWLTCCFSDLIYGPMSITTSPISNIAGYLCRTSYAHYWWPLPVIFVIGIILCLLSNYKSKHIKDKKNQINNCFPSFKNNPILPFFCWLWMKMLKAIGYIYAITLVLIVIYLGFHPDYSAYVFWSFWGLLIVGGCLWFAYRFYRDYDKKDDDNQNN